MVFSTASKIRGVTVAPRRGLRGGAPLPGDFRLMVCLTPLQMNDFGDLLGTPYGPVSKKAPVKVAFSDNKIVPNHCLQTFQCNVEKKSSMRVIWHNILEISPLKNTIKVQLREY